MNISYELDLNTFDAWSGAVGTLDRIKNAGKCEELESILDDTFPDGMTDTELNDLLWFEDDMIFEWLGMRTETQIREELDNEKAELESLLEDYNCDAEDMSKEEAMELYKEDYEIDIDDIKERIAELEEELEDL